MWRDSKNNSRPEKARLSNNRLRLVVAVIFLLSGALVYKLFNIQIKQCDLYTALASSQQQTSSKLKPERGKIFLTEKTNGGEKLYPLATNKDFAVFFAVPKDVVNPRDLAEKFYEYFDRPLLEEELRKALPFNNQATSAPVVIASSTKEEKIRSYLKRLDKPGDVYEPLEKKVDVATLPKFYAFLLSSTSTPVQADSLDFKNDKVVWKTATSSSRSEVKIPGIDFDLQKFRYYPENEIASHLLGFVSYNAGEGRGRYGLEEFFDEELFGKYGSVKSERGGRGNVIIVNDREYLKPEKGNDLILSIDRNVEFVACAKLKEAVKKHGATGGSVIAMNPKTGAIIAMCSVPDFDPNNYKQVEDIKVFNNPAVFEQYEPGSVFKTVTMSMALDQGKLSPSSTYKDTGEIMIKGWPKPIRNSDFDTKGAHGIVDMNYVLENSLNTGAIYAMTQVGAKTFAEYTKNYGFGESTGIELGAESKGNIANLLKPKIAEIDAATSAFGQGIAATPLQMIMPYQVIANQGILMKPYVVQAIVKSDGKREEIKPKMIRRVISERTANTVAAMLVNVVELGHSKKASINGYYIGGKTGTAQIATRGGYLQNQYIHTFIGIVPIDDPAFVMLTKIDNPKDVVYAEGSVVPLWKDIADFMLKYYAIPKTRE